MHRVAILALDGVVAFDLGIPCHAFGIARLADGTPAYQVRMCVAGTVSASDGAATSFAIRSRYRLSDAAGADTIIVPGLLDVDQPPSRAVVALLRAASERGARVASVCTGAFTLAAAGLLDHLRATTHWEGAEELARRFPTVTVEPGVLYVDNDGKVLTSAGVAAGLDMCLYMIGCDHGAAVAGEVARRMVVPMVRQGGQAQFIAHTTPRAGADADRLQATLDWMQASLRLPLSLDDIAAHAMMSIRSLNRHFRERVATTPLQWLLTLRVERTKALLETTDLSIERIADQVGFGSSAALRQHFTRRVGVPPHRYRTAFRAPRPVAHAS